jgi:L-amino acid N-acyltransferase YncA
MRWSPRHVVLVAVRERLSCTCRDDFCQQWHSRICLFRGLERRKAGNRYTVEHTVHVRHDVRGQGVGSTLVEALFPRAIALGKHVMIGGIDAANEASIRFHERLGFERVAYFREVGHKFGRWLDLVFMQRFLDTPGAPRD